MRRLFFFFNDTATTEIYTLSLHDALPIYVHRRGPWRLDRNGDARAGRTAGLWGRPPAPRRILRRAEGGAATERSEEHTSELQSQSNLVCRLLLEEKIFVLSRRSENIISRL